MKALMHVAVMAVGLLLTVMIKLRLGIVALYIFLANTVWYEWTKYNETLSVIVLFGLLGLVAASWVFTIVRKVRV